MYTIHCCKVVAHTSSVTKELTIIFCFRVRAKKYLLSNCEMITAVIESEAGVELLL